jgi:hypothetical protein
MDGGQFQRALKTDPNARVFIDRYGIKSTAHLAGGRWVAHPASTEAGREVDADRLFDPTNWQVWELEQDRVSRAYYADLVTIELAEPLPDTTEVYCRLRIPLERGPDGEWLFDRIEATVRGERVIVVPSADLHKYPGARRLEP